MDSGLAALLGASVGAISASVAQVVATVRQTKQRRADRRLELLEGALNAISRERRLLASMLSLWTAGLPPDHHSVADLDMQLAVAIEDVWIAENSLRVHFGSDSAVVGAFSSLILALADMKAALRPASGAPNPEVLGGWQTAHKSIVRIQVDFVETIRRVAALK